MSKEEVNLKNLSIIFSASLILLIGFYFIFHTHSDVVKECCTIGEHPITDCKSLAGKILNDFELSENLDDVLRLNSYGHTASIKRKEGGVCGAHLEMDYNFDPNEKKSDKIELRFKNKKDDWSSYGLINFLIKSENPLEGKIYLKLYRGWGGKDDWLPYTINLGNISNWKLVSVQLGLNDLCLKAFEKCGCDAGAEKCITKKRCDLQSCQYNLNEAQDFMLVFPKNKELSNRIYLDHFYLTRFGITH